MECFRDSSSRDLAINVIPMTPLRWSGSESAFAT